MVRRRLRWSSVLALAAAVSGCGAPRVRIDTPPLIPPGVAQGDHGGRACVLRSIRHVLDDPWENPAPVEIEVGSALIDYVRAAVAASGRCSEVLRPVQAAAAPPEATQLEITLETRYDRPRPSSALHILAGFATLYLLTHAWPLEQGLEQEVRLEISRPADEVATLTWRTRGTVEIRHLIRMQEDPHQLARRLLYVTVLQTNLKALALALVPVEPTAGSIP